MEELSVMHSKSANVMRTMMGQNLYDDYRAVNKKNVRNMSEELRLKKKNKTFQI